MSKLTYLGWSCFLLLAGDGTTTMIDPYFGDERPGFPARLQRMVDLVEQLPALDVIAVTHNDSDHFGEAFRLAKNFGSVLCCGVDVREHALSQGVAGQQIGLVVNGSELMHQGIRIKAVESHHISTRKMGGYQFTGQSLGFMVTDTAENVTIYHPGDTAIFGDMALYGRIYKPTVALLGVGGIVFGGRTIAELPPREAAIAANMLGVKFAVPMHYFPETTVARDFTAALATEAPQCQAIVMQPGDAIVVSELGVEGVG